MELKTFGERLFWARRHHAKLTQQQLRDRLQEEHKIDIGRNYISQIETDLEANPTFSLVRAMAAVLGVSTDFLAGFTDQYVPTQGEEAATYFSEEADAVAQLVDAMHPQQRQLLLGVAQSMTSAPTKRQLERAEIAEMLDSIERQHGEGVRRDVEDSLRKKGVFVQRAP